MKNEKIIFESENIYYIQVNESINKFGMNKRRSI